jgi:hypothetical protein
VKDLFAPLACAQSDHSIGPDYLTVSQLAKTGHYTSLRLLFAFFRVNDDWIRRFGATGSLPN